MASRLNPYITFDGNAREAMEFYGEVLGGSLTVSTFGELGGATGSDADKVMHSQLESDLGFTLMGSDSPPGAPYNAGTNISVSLSGDDEDALRSYWERLSEGGTVTVPFEKQVWGDEFGALIDRFGVSWLVDIVHPQS